MPYIAPDRITEPLYVVTPIFNPVRWKSRWKLYQRFQKHIVDVGGILYTIEAAFGAREHALVGAPHKEESDTPMLAGEAGSDCKHDDARRATHRYIRMRVRDELWLKENLINVAVSHLPSDWKYVAWIDSDVMFTRPNIIGETIHQLQHYDFVQMFSHAQDVGPDYRVLSDRPGFIAWHLAGGKLPSPGYYYEGKRARQFAGVYSGLAWACTREAWDNVGGLLDVAVHGGGDWHMAFALLGEGMASVRRDVHPGYKRRVQQWQHFCDQHVRRNVGCVSGTITHFFHGKKVDRRYADRHELLAVTQFNPDTDLKRDAQGLYQLVDDGSERFIWLRDGLRMYARMRNEDSVDV